MFGSGDQSAALAALARLEEANLFLMTASTEAWRGSAASAAQAARSEHIGGTSDAISRVEGLLILLRRRDDLRALVTGVSQ